MATIGSHQTIHSPEKKRRKKNRANTGIYQQVSRITNVQYVKSVHELWLEAAVQCSGCLPCMYSRAFALGVEVAASSEGVAFLGDIVAVNLVL